MSDLTNLKGPIFSLKQEGIFMGISLNCKKSSAGIITDGLSLSFGLIVFVFDKESVLAFFPIFFSNESNRDDQHFLKLVSSYTSIFGQVI